MRDIDAIQAKHATQIATTHGKDIVETMQMDMWKTGNVQK